MSRTAIIDTGLCNLDSIARAVEECGGYPLIATDASSLRDSGYVILPGVGAFPDAMKGIRRANLVDALREHVLERRRPFLGICLGMHLMAKRSTEGKVTEGLGWLDGQIERLQSTSPEERIPHVGWNEVEAGALSVLFRNVAPGTDFYFVHSYHLVCNNPTQIAGNTPYCGGFVSAVEADNIMGVQFHPEKSQKPGFQVLRNFLSL